jgi:hypothetical protein
LERASLFGITIDGITDLSSVIWGGFLLEEELSGHFIEAEVTYRRLKRWYLDHGDYSTAGEFAYRENVAHRKSLPQTKRLSRTWSWLQDMLFGYGERPSRVVLAWLFTILVFASAYWGMGGIDPSGPFHALYFSAVSFAAVGYGGWLQDASGLARTLGVIETFIGVFLLALFVTTFVRRYTR